MAVVAPWKLALLGYPRAAELALSAPAEVATLVAFLEDRHVRALPAEEREPLRRAGAGFAPALDAYLRHLACPLLAAPGAAAGGAGEAPLADRLAWLTQHALALAFEDGAAGFNAAAAAEEQQLQQPAAAATAGEAAAASASAAAEVLPADAHALVLELARLLRVPTEARDAAHVLQGCHRVLRMRVLPAVAELEASADADPGAEGRRRPASAVGTAASSSGGGDVMRDFGAGFATGDAVLDRACAILRMLYVADLRELQDAVNDILVEIQCFTADPKTDAALGVVGR